MTKFRRLFLANAMLGGNALANLTAVAVAQSGLTSVGEPTPEFKEALKYFGVIFNPLALAFFLTFIVRYEQPVRKALKKIQAQVPLSEEELLQARRRVLNEPYITMLLNMITWCLAAAVIVTMAFFIERDPAAALMIGLSAVLNGLITVTVAFFILERVLQKHMAPVFFEQGNLWATPGAAPMWIGVRMTAQTMGASLTPFLIILLTLWAAWLAQDRIPAEELLDMLRQRMIIQISLFTLVAAILAYLVTTNITRPIRELTEVLKGVKNGDFEKKVRVSSNDEIGYAGDVINEMTDGLKDRERMRHSLLLAQEVQRSLLPSGPPEVRGLDLAGLSLYCDETGGDYFDFIELGERSQGRVGLVLGDVSDHGVQSALLMTTARAFLRLRASLPGDIAEIITDVNRMLAQDVEESGQFMTLFFLEISPSAGQAAWVSAGHDPALLYDPQTDSFEELGGGRAPALGFAEDFRYQARTRALKPGQILVLATDGIWEAHNRAGEMFGKDRLKEVIRDWPDLPAKDLIARIVAAVEDFTGLDSREDDITLAAARITGRAEGESG